MSANAPKHLNTSKPLIPSLTSHCIARAGQALVDSVTAAAYNVIFTSVPILIFAVVDRPVQHFETLIRYPQASPRLPLAKLQ